VKRLQEGVQRFAVLPADSARRGFGSIAAEYSEQQDTRYVGGDLGWLTDDEISRRLPAGPAAAALALTSSGQCSNVVTSGTTAFVVYLSGRRAAATPPFERVAAQINSEFARRRDRAIQGAQQHDLRQDLTIQIDEERLLSLDLRPALKTSFGSGMQSPAVPPLGPSSQ
jgi:parvulin-like peptidyl-prolyl isomerase